MHTQQVARILELESTVAIQDWLRRVEDEPEIMAIPMSGPERSAHLPAIFHDLITRLRTKSPLGTHALTSDAAMEHGCKRRVQGYTPAMMVEESRILQVSIFETLQKHLQEVDSRLLLLDVMVIADEVDAQLAQAMSSYVDEANADDEPIEA